MGGHTEVGMRACDFDLLKAGCPRYDAASVASDGRHHGFSKRLGKMRAQKEKSEPSESAYLPKSGCLTMDAASAASTGGHPVVGVRAGELELLKRNARYTMLLRRLPM